MALHRRWRTKQWLVVASVIACALATAGCSGGGTDEPAVGSSRPTSTSTSSTSAPTTQPAPEVQREGAFWELDPGYPVSDADTTVHILLRPPACAGDIEREPLPADVEVVDGEIHIAAFVRWLELPNSERVCEDRTFPMVVDLGTSIDGRPLVDGLCLLGGSRAGPNPREWCIERP